MASQGNIGRRAYSPEEVAELYGVTRHTVYEWLQTGRLAGMKVSDGPRAKWRVSPAALDAFEAASLRSRCFAPDPDAAAGS
jgi:excisionase family DNA binding protein